MTYTEKVNSTTSASETIMYQFLSAGMKDGFTLTKSMEDFKPLLRKLVLGVCQPEQRYFNQTHYSHGYRQLSQPRNHCVIISIHLPSHSSLYNLTVHLFSNYCLLKGTILPHSHEMSFPWPERAHLLVKCNSDHKSKTVKAASTQSEYILSTNQTCTSFTTSSAIF